MSPEIEVCRRETSAMGDVAARYRHRCERCGTVAFLAAEAVLVTPSYGRIIVDAPAAERWVRRHHEAGCRGSE